MQQDLFDPLPRVMNIKAKINKGDLVTFKSFYTAKETISLTFIEQKIKDMLIILTYLSYVEF